MAFDALIVETMLPDWPLLDRVSRDEVTRATIRAVTAAVKLAPLHIRLGVMSLSVPLGLLVLLAGMGAGGPAVRAIRAARLYDCLQRCSGILSGVIRLYRSMTLLAFYEQPAVLLALQPPAKTGQSA